MTQTYKALVGTRQDGKLSVGFAQLDAADIGDGDVEIAVEYSTLNSHCATRAPDLRY